MSNKIDIQNAVAMLHTEGYTITPPVSEPVKEGIDVRSVIISPAIPICSDWARDLAWYNFACNKPIDQTKFPAIKQAIEDILNK